jgi:hypothetical protein
VTGNGAESSECCQLVYVTELSHMVPWCFLMPVLHVICIFSVLDCKQAVGTYCVTDRLLPKEASIDPTQYRPALRCSADCTDLQVYLQSWSAKYCFD